MTTRKSDRDGYKLIFYASPQMEEGLAAWCDTSGGEYAIDTKPEAASDEDIRYSVFPQEGLTPEESMTQLQEYLLRWAQYSGVSFFEIGFRIRPIRNDWARVWRRFFRGREAGQGFFIAPPWETPPETDRVLLTIDPGACFGTGHHPTTLLCIEYLEQAALEGKVLLDAGSGSGVLSLVAAKCGARCAYGFDIDPEAENVARSNAHGNGLADTCFFKTGTCDVYSGYFFDIIVANMLPQRFLPLLSDFHSMLNPGGELFLSGIDASQLPGVLEEVRGLFPGDPLLTAHEGWRALGLVRNA